MYDTHTCSYHCKRLKCIEAQRDELRDKMDKLIAEAVAAEREACAKVCEEIEMQGHALWDRTADPEAQGRSIAASDCADAIRARGQT